MLQLSKMIFTGVMELEQRMENYLKELVTWVQAQPEILATYLYGSQVEGRATPLSDVDVGLLVKPQLSKSHLWRLEDRWLAHWPDVDLRVLNLAPLSFQYQVTAQGQRLWTADVDSVSLVGVINLASLLGFASQIRARLGLLC